MKQLDGQWVSEEGSSEDQATTSDHAQGPASTAKEIDKLLSQSGHDVLLAMRQAMAERSAARLASVCSQLHHSDI